MSGLSTGKSSNLSKEFGFSPDTGTAPEGRFFSTMAPTRSRQPEGGKGEHTRTQTEGNYHRPL